MAYLERSLEASINSNLFTKYRNTIDIYTEDVEKDKGFYLSIFERLLVDTNIKINDVTTLGSYEEVVKAWQSLKTEKRGKIYIIDGDINVILSPKKNEEGLYVLDRYCIENYVIDEDAFVKMFAKLSGSYTENQIKNIVDVNAYLKHFALYVVPLYLHFAVVDKYGKKFDIPNVGRYCDDKSWEVIEEEVEKLIKKGWDNVDVPIDELDAELKTLNKRYPSNIDTLCKVVRGKDIIKFVKCKCINTFRVKGIRDLECISLPNRGWKYQLAEYANLKPLIGLKQAIIEASYQPT